MSKKEREKTETETEGEDEQEERERIWKGKKRGREKNIKIEKTEREVSKKLSIERYEEKDENVHAESKGKKCSRLA